MPIYPISMTKRKATADKSIEDITDPEEKKKYLGSWYAISDYTAVNPDMGTLQDFQALDKTAHDNGMYVILDWVANHTSWDHPWISAHPEWYSQNANGQIIIPPGTNWNDVADLNFNQAAMRAEQIADMKYWILEANVDGFRCDYADGVPFDFWSEAITALKSLNKRDVLMLAEGTRSDHYQAGFDLTYSWNYYTAIFAHQSHQLIFYKC